MSNSDRLKELHNQGQTDGSNGEYNPPHSLLDEFLTNFTSPVAGVEKQQEENGAYNDGYQHNWEQTHRGCFLTTACIEAAGLSDDCDELTTLRRFRDTFIRSLDGGEAILQEYYELAPRIVGKLSPDELRWIYTIVQVAVEQIRRGELVEAYSTYSVMFERLCEKHLGIAAACCPVARKSGEQR